MDDSTNAGVSTEFYRNVMELTRAGGSSLRRLRVQEGELAVEMDWATAEAAEGVPVLPAPRAAVAETDESTAHQIKAPMVGTFYHRPEPGAKPFVEVGDLVTAGQQVGLLEAMKLMNPVESDCEGQVIEILVPDGAPIEYGQPLIAVQPLDAA